MFFLIDEFAVRVYIMRIPGTKKQFVRRIFAPNVF